MSNLPTDAAQRKLMPIFRGVLRYFPDALAEVANVSRVGNEQHNPGQPMHWAKEKSSDEGDALIRHLIDAGTFDTDGLRHSAKVAWRALALLQREIDASAEQVAVWKAEVANVTPPHPCHKMYDCPDLDQGASDAGMVYAEEEPLREHVKSQTILDAEEDRHPVRIDVV